MQCLYPLRAHRAPDPDNPGKLIVSFNTSKSYGDLDSPPLDCRNCIACRINRAQRWTKILFAEHHVHAESSFVTLTYDDDHLPENFSLEKNISKQFIAPLRERLFRKNKKRTPIKYYLVGEYGDQSDRPHYHALLFGFMPDDLRKYSGEGDRTLFTSHFLQSVWKKGQVLTGTVTPESISYCAKYCLKKLNQTAMDDRHEIDSQTYELLIREPEFQRFSKELGLEYMRKYEHELLVNDSMIMNGRETSLPSKFTKKLEEVEPTKIALNLHERKLAAQKNISHLSPADRELLIQQKIYPREKL